MQSMLGLAIGLFLSGQAVAEVDKSEFFDFEEAKKIWTTVRTYEAHEAYKEANCPAWGVRASWEAQYNQDPKAALEALKKHPQADKLRRCFDFRRVGSVHGNMTIYWEFGGNDCAEVAKYNIFTHRCDDVPDWRTPIQVKRDQRRLEASKQTLRIYGK
jgi:hypothetical protein